MTPTGAKVPDRRVEGCGSVYWQTHIPLWRASASAPGAEKLIDIEEPDMAILMWSGMEDAAAAVDPDAAGGTAGIGKDGRQTGLIAHGDPVRIGHALESLALDTGEKLPGPAFAMVPRSLRGVLSPSMLGWFGEHWGNDWDFYWTDTALPARSGQERVERIDDGALGIVRDVLAQASPTSEAIAELETYRWFGIREKGEMAAVIGSRPGVDGSGNPFTYLGGLGTLPRFRGRGIGGALLAGVTARDLESHGTVTFGMWGENPARRLYDSLGFINGGEQVIASVTPFDSH